MKTHFRHALQDIRDVDDVPASNTYDQANMIQEVLEGVRGIVRDQVAEALPSFSSPNYPTSHSIPPFLHTQPETAYNPHFQQVNAVTASSFANANVASSERTFNRKGHQQT